MGIIQSLEGLSDLGFGQHFAPFMVRSDFKNSEWSPPEVVPYGSLGLDPAAKVFHYGQEIFEGMKIYRSSKGKHLLFRPDANIRRMKHSSEMLAMPEFPEKLFTQALRDLAAKVKAFVPERPGALYLRPTLLGVSTALGVAPAKEYVFFVLASPVGGYFGAQDLERAACINCQITSEFVRAVRGGLGTAKAGANYAASLRAVELAKKKGFSNVLFLDALERKFLEELSGMNVFLVTKDKKVLTPPLGDTILAGITRDSLLQLAPKLGYVAEERKLTIEDLLEGLKTGAVTEAFACGTGATVSAITEFGWKDKNLAVGDKVAGPVTNHLYQQLCAIQFGEDRTTFPQWSVALD